jgi:hypothetical protein
MTTSSAALQVAADPRKLPGTTIHRGACMETTWTPAFAVLDLIVRRFDEQGPDVLIEASDLAKRTDMSPGQVSLAVHDLQPTYLKAEPFEDPDVFLIHQVTDQGRRAVLQWPEVAVDRVVQALRDAADQQQNPNDGSKLRSAADTIGGSAREVAINAIANRPTG